MNILLFGPPSAGKGTQAKQLENKYDLKHISTGDIFRYHIKNETDLGKQVKEYLREGKLVPDELTIALVETALEDHFLLDGFPRTIAQAKALDQLLQEKAMKLDAIVVLNVDEDELIQRVIGRRMCSQCGASYHTSFQPPKEEGVCDLCQGDLYQREDDTKETYGQRLSVYKEQTQPLLEYYGERGIVHFISADGTVEEVTKLVNEVLENLA